MASDTASNIRRDLLIVSAWMEILELVVEAADLDKAHVDRIGAVEDSIERLLSAAQEFPTVVRRGPVLGLKNVMFTLAGDVVDAEQQIEHDDLPDDEAFCEREADAGTVSALLYRMGEAMQDVEDHLVGPARELTIPTHVPDEIVCVGHVSAMEWASVAIGSITRAESTLMSSKERSSPTNLAIVRDAWVAILSFACALAQIADHDALNARTFLGVVSDAFHAADRAAKSLVGRRSLSPWREGDEYGNALLAPLNELKTLADRATNIVIDGLMERDNQLGRIAWRELSGGRIELGEAQVRELVAEGLKTKSDTLSRLGSDRSQLLETLVGVSKAVKVEWARRA